MMRKINEKKKMEGVVELAITYKWAEKIEKKNVAEAFSKKTWASNYLMNGKFITCRPELCPKSIRY